MDGEKSLTEELAGLSEAEAAAEGEKDGTESAGQVQSVSEAAERELAPIRAELEKLRELKREIIFEKVKLTHPELDLGQIRQSIGELEDRIANNYVLNGLSRETARDLAKKTASLWENEEGLTALSIAKKVKNGEINLLLKPDAHIAPNAPATKGKGWKEKIKSSDPGERLSVFDEIF
jgi:hypothetical protein